MELPSEKELRDAGIAIAQDVIDTAKLIAVGELSYLLDKKSADWKDPNNRTLGIDQHAHTVATKQLKLKFGEKIVIYGEEAEGKPGKHFAQLNKVVAIIDPVDGTDLLAKDFSNWVSAMIFFIPKQKKILAAVVGHSSGDIYYATEKGAYRRPRNAGGKQNHDKKLRCMSEKVVELCNASICFYGQKPKSFLALAQHKGFIKMLEGFKQRMAKKEDAHGKQIKGEELEIRLYNFGGNPMMVKVPSGAVSAVFSLGNTELHDVMPGAYIAAKAGAVFTDLSGKTIDPVAALLSPNEPLRYILSGSRALAQEIQRILAQAS